MRHKIRLSYDGSAFCGWQIQNNAKTVQGSLENALSTLLGQPVSITGAGRTDTEVNAINYIAHFDMPDVVSMSAEQLCYKLNAILPREIVVHEVTACAKEVPRILLLHPFPQGSILRKILTQNALPT